MSAIWQANTVEQRRADDIYFPHPAPSSRIDDEEESKMGATLSLLKTLIVPALISLILFLIVSYVVVPFWKRYRARYSQYLPLETITSQTSSFRQRAQAAFARYLAPSSWRANFDNRYVANAELGFEGDFNDEEGEELSDVDEHRREALSLDSRRDILDDRRLSRDLEEGFKDDSDEEADADDRHIRNPSR